MTPEASPRLPNLVLAGAPKSGSTTLYHHLRSHPECQMSTTKGSYFFSRKSNRDQLGTFEQFLPDDESSTSTPRIIGDATVDYLYEPEVPDRLLEWLPEPPRLVFILRDPIERAVSDYWHRHKKFNDVREFEHVFRLDPTTPKRVLEQERNRVRLAYDRGTIDVESLRERCDLPLVHFCYLMKSFYSAYLKRFRSRVGSSRTHVLLVEQLREEPEPTLDRLWDFLGLSSHRSGNPTARHNPTIVPRQGGLFDVVHRSIRPFLGGLIQGTKPRWLRRIYHGLAFRNKPSTPAELRDRFRGLFAGERDRLREEFDLPTDRFWEI